MAVHFASTIPLKSELKESERAALKNTLEELDSEQFQIFSPPPNPNVLFFVQRQYQLGSSIATGPSLALERSSLSLFKAIKIQNETVTSNDSIFAEEYNTKARDVLYRVQNAIKTKFTRVGKIFELAAGPYSPEETKKLLSRFLPNDSSELAEFQLITTKLIKTPQRVFNVNRRVQIAQPQADQAAIVHIRIDINNRKHESSLEPRDVDAIWKEADKIIAPEIEQILG